MNSSLYNFSGGQSGIDPQAQANLQQYITQGQAGISPGQASVAASSPVNTAAMANLAKAFAQSQQPQTVDPAQAALTNGAQMQPNVNGQNMGGVGPTMNNANAMQSYQGMTTQPQSYADQLANFLSPQGGT